MYRRCFWEKNVEIRHPISGQIFEGQTLAVSVIIEFIARVIWNLKIVDEDDRGRISVANKMQLIGKRKIFIPMRI